MVVSKITQVVPIFGKMETGWRHLTERWVFKLRYGLPCEVHTKEKWSIR
jgi:hypothetical protein